MHIAYLIDELAVRGGSEKSLYVLADALAETELRVSVFCLSEGGFGEEFRKNGKFFFQCLSVKRVYDTSGLRGICKLIQYINNEKVDVLQSMHTGSDMIAPIASIFSKKNPVVISSRRDLGFTKKAHHVVAQKILNFRVTKILVNSIAVKRSVVETENYPEEKIKIIYNGLDLNLYRNLEKEKSRQKLLSQHNLPNDTYLIGSAGNLNPVKGHKYLIEAMVKVIEKMPNAYCVLAGEGSEKDSLSLLAQEKRVSDRIIFLGNIQTIPEFLTGLDIYVQPSLSEGFSNSILEAMAAGCAVVATDVGGNREAIVDEENGFIVPAGDVTALTEKISLLLGAGDMRLVIGENGKKRIMKNFSLEGMLGDYRKFYEGIVGTTVDSASL
jgi:L-malate glycosyltransferase